MKWVVPLLLAGCVAAPADLAEITFGNTGSITGPGFVTTVRADDSVTVAVNDWSRAESGATQTFAIVPGSFARVAALLAAEGPAVQAAIDPDLAACQDYGTDFIAATPRVGGIARIAAGCFDESLIALTNRLSSVVTAP